MRKSDIYEIAIKILGLYLVVFVIGQLREVMMYASILTQSGNDPADLGGIDQAPVFIAVVLSFLILVAFSTLLIFRTRKISRLICKKEDFEESVSLFIDKKNIYEIALTIVGLLTIVITLPEFAIKFKSYIKQLPHTLQANDNDFLLITALKTIVGVLVISFSKSISSYLANTK